MKKIMKLLILSLIISTTAAISQNTKNVEIVTLTTQTFKQKVWNFELNKKCTRIGNLPIILDFHATWNRQCKMMVPHLQAIQNKYKNQLIVYRIDVDKEPELAKLFKLEAVPTIVFLDSKTTYKIGLGYKEYNDLEKLVKTYLSIN